MHSPFPMKALLALFLATSALGELFEKLRNSTLGKPPTAMSGHSGLLSARTVLLMFPKFQKFIATDRSLM